MPFKETHSLLNNNDQESSYRLKKQYSKRYDKKFIILLITLAGLILFLLWIKIVQPNNFLSRGEFSSNIFNTSLQNTPPSKVPASATPKTTATISSIGNTTIFHYNFILTEGTISPDNYAQNGYLINGQSSPGPEIRIKKYSTLIVHITNKLKVGVTFHFHGIHQSKSFLSDGVPMVTQKIIPPGGTFTYEIDTWPQVGTFFYHAHTGLDIIWLYGPLNIEDDSNSQSFPAAYQYDEDRVFTLSGIYHESLTQIMTRITGPVHQYPAVASSIALNGRSYGLWGTKSNAAYKNTTGYYVTNVEQGKTYRFRFINAASDSLLCCNVTAHSFTVIETDGVYVDPIVTDHIVITPGQRYSVLIKMNQPIGNYHISCKQMESYGPLNGIGILHNDGASPPTDKMLREDRVGEEALPLDNWILDQLHPNVALGQIDLYKVPKNVDREFVIDAFEAVVGQQHIYLVNGHYFEEPIIPYFMQLKQGINITNPPQVFEILEGESIQIVFQNQRTDDFCFSHPWHIHGHSFHVVGHGANRYDPIVDGTRIQKDIADREQFQFRDSVTVYANQTLGDYTDGAFCGWTAVRFSAHNPGLWLGHCHVTPHLIMGKKFVIWEHSIEDPYLKELMTAKSNRQRVKAVF